MQPKPMLTMSQIMKKLADKGITAEFCMDDDGNMHFSDEEKTYEPADLKVLKSYRFEGASDPADNAVLYVAKSTDGKKGMIIDSYGADSNNPESFDDFIRNIPVEEDDEYNFE